MFATRRNDTGPSRRSRPCLTGPYKVLKCLSDWEYQIQHIVSDQRFFAHASRLKYYCDKDLNVTADLKHQVTHDEMRYKVRKFRNHMREQGDYKFLTEWLGFDPEDASWEPVVTLLEDVPDMCRDYIDQIPDSDPLKSNLINLMSISSS